MIEKFFIPNKTADNIENCLLYNDYFAWFYRPCTVQPVDEIVKSTSVNNPQLQHTFFTNGEVNSKYFDDVIKVFKGINFPYDGINLHRVKANLNFSINNYQSHNHQPIHKDNSNKNFRSFLYYVDDSDGDTLFFDEDLNVVDSIKPKKGMGILFNSNIKHAAQNPRKNFKRTVINYVFKL